MKPFDVLRNLKSSSPPHLATYAGPKLALYNSTANCSLGLSEETDLFDDFVFKRCDTLNFRDPRLDLWITSDNFTESSLKPQIISTKEIKAVYCPMNNVTIENVSLQCPHYPFLLPRTVNFSVGNYSHEAEKLFLRGTTSFEAIQAPVYKPVNVDQSYREQVEWINDIIETELKRKNVTSKIGDRSSTNAEPKHWLLDMIDSITFQSIFAGSGGFFLIFFLFSFLRNSERFNVMQFWPSTQAVKTPQPEVLPELYPPLVGVQKELNRLEDKVEGGIRHIENDLRHEREWSEFNRIEDRLERIQEDTIRNSEEQTKAKKTRKAKRSQSSKTPADTPAE